MAAVAQDLSLKHSPVSDIFAQPQSPEEWLQYALTEEQVAHFKEFGYVKDIRILTEEQVELLRAEQAELANPEHPGNELFYEYHSNEAEDPTKTLFHALGGWRVTPGFHDVCWSPVYRMACYQLMGGPVRLFHDQLFCKPAKHGGVVAWHQDFSYWTWTAPMNHLTCWIGLDKATTENGCMWYVPGSHTWGLLPITGLTGGMDAVREVLTEEQEAAFDKKVPVELEMGCASFHHPVLMHGSYANESERHRRALVLNTLVDGVKSNISGEREIEAMGNFPIIPQGEKMAGQFFPMLFDPEKELGAAAETIAKV